MMSEEDRRRGSAGDEYSAKWGSHVEGPSRARIQREVYGAEYPAEVDPRSHLTWTELRRIARELRVGPRDTFIDLGCGHGGPCLWVARETGATVTGVDLAEVGIARGRRRADELGLTGRARFEVADIVSTGFADASFDGAMSIDTLWAVPDKVATLHEVARVMKPGARFVFTNWDRDLSPPGYPPPLGDHRPLLEQAGFEVEVYEVQPEAEAKRREYYTRVIAAEPTLIEELGKEGSQKLLFEAKGTLGLTDGTDYLARSRRIFVVARRRVT